MAGHTEANQYIGPTYSTEACLMKVGDITTSVNEGRQAGCCCSLDVSDSGRSKSWRFNFPVTIALAFEHYNREPLRAAVHFYLLQGQSFGTCDISLWQMLLTLFWKFLTVDLYSSWKSFCPHQSMNSRPRFQLTDVKSWVWYDSTIQASHLFSV